MNIRKINRSLNKLISCECFIYNNGGFVISFFIPWKSPFISEATKSEIR